MRTLGIIPARGGSKRVVGKNMRLLAGKPLVAWAIEAARKAKRIDRLVVSSDDEQVLELARELDPNLPLRRPADIATDTAPAIDYVRHALRELERAERLSFGSVAIVQPSSPFTLTEDIDATIELLDRSGADTAVSVVEVEHALHPAKFKTLDGDRLLSYFEEERGRMAAHELPHLYVRNCSVYAISRPTIERGQIIGDDCRGYVMPRERSLDINDEQDFAFAEWLAERRLKKDS